MTNKEINSLLANCSDHEEEEWRLIETHISWVILSPDWVYKIKKPVQYSFLDFSSLDKRNFYCQREVALNNRLTEGIYVDIIPIRQSADRQISLGGQQGEILDYAVKMKRMDSSRQMDILLNKNRVSSLHLDQLAQQLSRFHQTSERSTSFPALSELQSDFTDTRSIIDCIAEVFGTNMAEHLEEGMTFANTFLAKYYWRLQERYEQGWVVDGHGDLHTGNIFLLKKPVVFDCIEFNDHFRQLDILDELAFLCMDLDAFQRNDLSQYFLQRYTLLYPVMTKTVDHLLFLYFKWYRANIRLKVSGLKLIATSPKAPDYLAAKNTLNTYLRLFIYYLELLKSLGA